MGPSPNATSELHKKCPIKDAVEMFKQIPLEKDPTTVSVICAPRRKMYSQEKLEYAEEIKHFYWTSRRSKLYL
jgi:hypothetical protein